MSLPRVVDLTIAEMYLSVTRSQRGFPVPPLGVRQSSHGMIPCANIWTLLVTNCCDTTCHNHDTQRQGAAFLFHQLSAVQKCCELENRNTRLRLWVIFFRLWNISLHKGNRQKNLTISHPKNSAAYSPWPSIGALVVCPFPIKLHSIPTPLCSALRPHAHPRCPFSRLSREVCLICQEYYKLLDITCHKLLWHNLSHAYRNA